MGDVPQPKKIKTSSAAAETSIHHRMAEAALDCVTTGEELKAWFTMFRSDLPTVGRLLLAAHTRRGVAWTRGVLGPDLDCFVPNLTREERRLMESFIATATLWVQYSAPAPSTPNKSTQ